MKPFIILSILFGYLTFGGIAQAAKKGERSAADVLVQSQHKGDFSLALNTFFEERSMSGNFEGSAQGLEPSGKKSIAKAVLFSAAIPGAGEFYAGSYLKGILFLAVEAAAWPLLVKWENEGGDLENEFEQFADARWEEDVYWDWLSEESGIDVNNKAALREYERANFTHFLPEQKNQQYYENIGKYDQFNIGWIDGEVGDGDDSELRFQYMDMRKHANDTFQRATNMATLIMFNHVLSALDAGFTTRSFNRKITASFHMQNMKYGSEMVPALVMGVEW